MKEYGWIYDTGERRETRSGSTARVWDNTHAGLTLLREGRSDGKESTIWISWIGLR